MPALRRRLSSGLLGIVAGVGLATYLACAPGSPGPIGKSSRYPDQVRAAKMQEILERWGNVQNWRHQAKMSVDPTNAAIIEMRRATVKEARRRVCENGHEVPKTCSDVCGIADDICDNAERICVLADELGKDDVLAQDKCASAKASCREAQQKCCDCSTASVQSPAAAPSDGGQKQP